MKNGDLVRGWNLLEVSRLETVKYPRNAGFRGLFLTSEPVSFPLCNAVIFV